MNEYLYTSLLTDINDRLTNNIFFLLMIFFSSFFYRHRHYVEEPLKSLIKNFPSLELFITLAKFQD